MTDRKICLIGTASPSSTRRAERVRDFGRASRSAIHHWLWRELPSGVARFKGGGAVGVLRRVGQRILQMLEDEVAKAGWVDIPVAQASPVENSDLQH
jgi:hypothetical protein